MKANNHPLVKDLRRILDKHGMIGAVLIGIDHRGFAVKVSAGDTVDRCNAIGPALKSEEVDQIAYEIDARMHGFEP